MRKRNPIPDTVLDFLIYSNLKVNVQPTWDNPLVNALYDYLGRWFSKKTIIERIDLHISEKKREPLRYLDSTYYAENLKDYLPFYLKRQDIDQVHIDVDSEILVEINNQSRSFWLFGNRQSKKLFALLKQCITQRNYRDDNSFWHKQISFQVHHLAEPNEILYNMVFFGWKQEGKHYTICYRSINKDANIEKAFDLSVGFNNEQSIHSILDYSGNDFVLVFSLEDDTFTFGCPPLIKHDYNLSSIPLPGYVMMSQYDWPKHHELIEKYYTLYHLGNKKAKQALKDSEFNLNPSDD